MQRGKKKQQKEPFSNKENPSRGPAGFEAENCDKDTNNLSFSNNLNKDNKTPYRFCSPGRCP
jgi:hypothetical protein